MRYIPHTDEDIREMQEAVGISDLDELFKSVPAACRRETPMDLPEAMTEWDLEAHMLELAGKMGNCAGTKVYMGSGSYSHHIPSFIPYVAGRQEFVTAYTPYQPEMSQGTLQAIYEYQTYAARLMGTEVANASMYDGGTAMAEAALMALRINKKRSTVAVSAAVHPLYRRILTTYFTPTEFKLVELPMTADGRTDISAVADMDDLAAVVVQSPNFFGCIEDVQAVSESAHGVKALAIVGFSEALAYGLLKSPGSLGADIVCGEGQSLGLSQSFGGPGLGMFGCTMKQVRNMPGRVVGRANDGDGTPGFVLTLSTREQHIRREKATSNICSNAGHCALTAGMYMASLGGTGLRELAELNRNKSEYLKRELAGAGFEIVFSSPTFNEFTVKAPAGFAARRKELLAQNIVAGLPIERWYPELGDHYVFCVTETSTRKDIDYLVQEVAK